MREAVNPTPLSEGVHASIVTPFGTYAKARRSGEAFAAGAAKAGVMASRAGSAMAAPSPFRNRRRGRCRPTLIMSGSPAHLERRAPHDLEHEPGEPVLVRRKGTRDRPNGLSVRGR